MRLHHLALKATDPARLAPWYEALLGQGRSREQADAQGVRSVWIDLDGVILMIERAEPPPPGGPPPTGWHGVYFAVEPGSGAEWEVRLSTLGAPATHRTASTLYTNDPDGNRLGLSCWPAALFE